MGDSKFEGTQEEWDALVKKNNADASTKEETFLDRLIKEEQELDKKINGLTKALDSSEFAIKVGPYQFQLLHIQHSAMMAYSWTLKMRIGDLKKK